MRIKSIETKGFGGLPDGKLEVGGGLTVIKGANEAGKSFTIKAICQGLFGDASTSDKKIRDYTRKWNSEGAFLVRVEFEEGGETFVVERDYENKRNLLIRGDGQEVKDKGKIASLIGGMAGLPTEKAFTATACIRQEDVEGLVEERTSIREIMEERIAGSGSDTEKITKKLTKAAEKIRNKTGKKGELVDVEGDISELKDDYEDKKDRIERLARDKKELVRVKSELDVGRSTLTDKDRALVNSRKYIEALRNAERQDGDFNLAQGNLSKCKEAKQNIESSQASLADMETRLGELDEKIKKAESFAAVDRAWRELQEAHDKLKNQRADVRALDEKIAEQDKALNGLIAIDAAELRNARKLPVEIASFKSALAGQLFSVEVRPVGDANFSITADGDKVDGPVAEVHGEAVVEFPGVADVYFKNLAGEEEPIVDEVKRKEEVLAKILAKYGAEDVEALEELQRQRDGGVREKGELERKRASLLGDDSLEELEARLREKEEELDKAKEKRDALAQYALSEEELEKRRQEKEELSGRKQDMETLVSESRGVLSAVGDDEEELQAKVNECAKELAVARAALDDLAPFKCTSEEFTRLDREVGELRDRVGQLSQNEAILRDRISKETLGEEDLAAAEEKLAYLEERKERLLHKHALIRVIRENIAWAREESISGFSESIGERMGEILCAITGGKYESVEVDGNLGVKAFSEEKGEYLDLDSKEALAVLSSGTLDQMFLAARLAVLDSITGKSRPPLILDDTFVSFDDMGRKRNAFDLLKGIAGDYQVLYFTCHECPADLEVIEI